MNYSIETVKAAVSLALTCKEYGMTRAEIMGEIETILCDHSETIDIGDAEHTVIACAKCEHVFEPVNI